MKKFMILAAFAAIAAPQAAHAQLELIAGWDTFAFDPANRAPTVAVGVDEASSTFTAVNAGSDAQHMNGQFDGTWGSLDLTPAPSVDSAQNPNQDPNVVPGSTVVSRFVNGNNPSYEFTIVDSSGTDRDLGFFVFDGGSFRPRSARNWELSVISGALTPGVVASGRLDANDGGNLDDWTDVDISLSDLADNTLDANGTVTFGLSITGGGLNEAGEVALDEEGNPLNNGGHHGYLDNVGIGIGQLPDPTVPGDFNDDGNIDALDIDAYIGNLDVAAEGELARLDLNGDSQVTAADHEVLVTQLVSAGGLDGTVFGDANLDGTVNVLGDAAILVNNLGSTTAGWATGDFNADGQVNVLGDAAILVNNLGQSNAPGAAVATSAVPEPGSLSLLALIGAAAVARRRR